jgi:2-dehydropantoate 2-reductase
MRYVVYGAGAIGGSIGGALLSAGYDVVMIARGTHLDVMKSDGLIVRSPDGEVRHRVRAFADPLDAGIGADDVVFLSVKTQDSAGALAMLRDASGVDTAVVCAQNGVENERLALRLFRNVYGMYVDLPAEHIEPGAVEMMFGVPHGAIDLGRYPSGSDDRAAGIAADLQRAGFASRAVPEIMWWKYGKLVSGLGNAIKAVSGQGERYDAIVAQAKQEAIACMAAAGLRYADDEEQGRRRQAVPGHVGPKGAPGSGWQSLARATGRIETDYLNGEIVLLGRLHGIPTPVNETIQGVACSMARRRERPGSFPLSQLDAAIQAAIATRVDVG